MAEKVRVNITLSKEIVEFYQEYADSLGLPRSTAMVMALVQFRDQQSVIKLSNFMDKPLNK